MSLLQTNAFLTLGGFVACLYCLSWQLRLRPDDRQKCAATAVVASLAAILGQLAWFYFGGPSLGMSIRGNISYAAVMVALIWWAWETRWANTR